jgi:hypothetical protein
MEKLSKKEKKQCYNLVYRLRKKGIQVNTKVREIYLLWDSVFCRVDARRIDELVIKFKFNVQLIWI